MEPPTEHHPYIDPRLERHDEHQTLGPLEHELPPLELDLSLDSQIHWKTLPIDDQIEALIAHSIGSPFDPFPHHIHHSLALNPPCFSLSDIMGEDLQSVRQKIPSAPSSSTGQETHHPRFTASQSVPLSPIFADHQSLPSSSIAEPNIDPLLESLRPSTSTLDFDHSPPPTPPFPKPSHPGRTTESIQNNPQFNSILSVHSLGLSHIDVHGAGAGGGAAAVLEAVAAQQQQLGHPSTLTVNWNKDPAIKPKREVRKKAGSKSSKRQDDPNHDPAPTSYNPDQFRSWNRIHWTKDEEQLLLNEVELHWHRHDCMAHIMKRHGPNGSVSRTFADRTGVSLKDKAVNISSRWFRDGTEVSSSRRRAFARFRPKQLRGKPKNQLPGMLELPSFLDSTSAPPSSSSSLAQDPHLPR